MSIHINAKKGDFAKVVLMPGDPCRAEWITKNFLHDYKLVTNVRGILGFTGYSKEGKKISVMASGMGQPSIGIYSNELFSEYGVESIIRVGTCGAYLKNINLGDILIASSASSDFNFLKDYNLNGFYSAGANYDLLETSVKIAKKSKKKFHIGNILSEGIFYHKDSKAYKPWAELGVLGVEMESYSLYANAAIHRKKALTLLTVTDHFEKKGCFTSEQRQNGLRDMISIAIELANSFA
ncbi:MAG: purine-nucleoside phosphorylase [Bacilli bacterium]|nr:purine-nucleoside phosphorylase [Bacilli bacterium]